MTPIHVYYDGKCSLCAREINHYMRIAPPESFEWHDIASDDMAFKEMGYRTSDGLKALHAAKEGGEMHAGIDAFLLVWRGIGGYWRWLAGFVSLPGILQIARFAYRHFAAWRFKRLDHCQQVLKQEQASSERKSKGAS